MKLTIADFYFGAALSVLFNNNMEIALVEGGDERRIYEVTNNYGDFTLFMKYRSQPAADNDDYQSWVFSFTSAENTEIANLPVIGGRIILICGKDTLQGSEIAVLNLDEYNQSMGQRGVKHTGITVGRKKGARTFQVYTGNGPQEYFPIPSARIAQEWK